MYLTASDKTITLNSAISKGGEGEVFNILGDNKNCVKIYHERIRSQEKEDKLKYMILNPPAELESDNHKICWPKELIYNDGKFVGFLMSKSFDESLLPYHLCQPVIPNKLKAQWHKTFDRKSFVGIMSRLKLCVNIAASVNRIHNINKYIMVDLKPQNLLVTASGKVSIIDMDSIQIAENNKILFKAQVSTPEYTPPEANEVLLNKTVISKDWDVFSLGILVYEILCGIHPYVGSANAPNDNLNTIQEKIQVNLTHVIKGQSAFFKLPPPHEMFNNYSVGLKNIFKKIFNPYKLEVSKRPDINEFGALLFNEVNVFAEKAKQEAQEIIKQKKIEKKLKEVEAIRNYKKVSDAPEKSKEKNKTLKDLMEYPALILSVAVVVILLYVAYFGDGNSLRISNTYEKSYNTPDLEKGIEDKSDYEIGLEKYNKGEYYFSIPYFTKAIKSADNVALAYYNRGNAYYYLGKKHNAIADYRSAIGKDPDHGDAYFHLAITKKELGQFYCSDLKKACDLGEKKGCEWYNDQCR